jgi:hypothetical protein
MRVNAIVTIATGLLLSSIGSGCAQGPVPPPAPFPAIAQAGQPIVPVAPYPGLAQPGGPVPLAGAPPAPVPPAPPAPQPLAPQGTPVATGSVQLYLLNPDGEVDGLLLADGTVVKFPPHLGSVLTAAVKPGASVSVVGFPGAATSYGHAVHALSITNTATGQTVVDQPPATPPIPPFMRGLSRTSLTVSGTVARFLMNPPGDVDGLVLTSGEEVRFPPHLGQTVVTALGGRPGTSITASGYGARNAFGTAVEASSLVVGNQTIPLQ